MHAHSHFCLLEYENNAAHFVFLGGILHPVCIIPIFNAFLNMWLIYNVDNCIGMIVV